MLDPLFARIISIGLALLFISAAAHKLGDRQQFLGILQAYKIVPERMTVFIAAVVPWLEIVLGLAWLVSGISALQLAVVPLVSALLLTGYGVAIAVNLKRGRNYIDCGCGFSTNFGKTDASANTQQLSSSLLLRNAVLVIAALAGGIQTTERVLGLLDYAVLPLATIACVLIFGAFNQLLTNYNAMGAWRRSHG